MAIELLALEVPIRAVGADVATAQIAAVEAAGTAAAKPVVVPVSAPGAAEATAAMAAFDGAATAMSRNASVAARILRDLGIDARVAAIDGMRVVSVDMNVLGAASAALAKNLSDVPLVLHEEAAAAREAAAALASHAAASRAAMLGGAGGGVPPVGGVGLGGAGGAGETGALAEEASGATLAFGGLYAQLIAVVGALEAYEKAKEFIATGVEFESTIESAKLGIAAVVTSLGTVTDAQGRALDQTHAWAAASAMADEQIQKLYSDAARTSTTVQQLVTVFQGVIGAGLNAGASLDQIRRITTDAALAAGALNVPYSQLQVTLVE